MATSRFTLASVLAVAGVIALTVPGFAGAAFDGVYRGQSNVTHGPESTCGKNFAGMTKTVKNGSFD